MSINESIYQLFNAPGGCEGSFLPCPLDRYSPVKCSRIYITDLSYEKTVLFNSEKKRLKNFLASQCNDVKTKLGQDWIK